MRSLTGKYPRSLAGQVFALQVVVVVLLVAASVLALVAQARHDSSTEARNRSVAVAQTFAHSPGLLTALKAPDPSRVLQPLTEAGRKAAGVDFIVVMDTNGIRYTHPRPELIGKRVVATIALAAGLPRVHRDRQRPARPRGAGDRPRPRSRAGRRPGGHAA